MYASCDVQQTQESQALLHTTTHALQHLGLQRCDGRLIAFLAIPGSTVSEVSLIAVCSVRVMLACRSGASSHQLALADERQIRHEKAGQYQQSESG